MQKQVREFLPKGVPAVMNINDSLMLHLRERVSVICTQPLVQSYFGNCWNIWKTWISISLIIITTGSYHVTAKWRLFCYRHCYYPLTTAVRRSCFIIVIFIACMTRTLTFRYFATATATTPSLLLSDVVVSSLLYSQLVWHGHWRFAILLPPLLLPPHYCCQT